LDPSTKIGSSKKYLTPLFSKGNSGFEVPQMKGWKLKNLRETV